VPRSSLISALTVASAFRATRLYPALGGDVIANGQVSGNAVQFDIGTSDLDNAGTLSGNSMSGTLTLRIATGRWRGSRPVANLALPLLED